MHKKHAIIIGAGFAGLTAAHYFLKHADIRPIVLEREKFVGGLSRTVDFGGNRLDLGRHKFFSTDEEILSLWRELLPEDFATEPQPFAAQIFCRGKFFDCPVSPNLSTLKSLGLFEMFSFGANFLKSKFSRRDENSLEDCLVNRYGQKFYETFFRDYATKIFGRTPEKICADITLVDCADETTFAKKFFYPVNGAGSLCKKLSDEIKRLGGEVLTSTNVKNFRVDANKVKSVAVESPAGTLTFPADYFLSSMTLDELVTAFDEKILPSSTREIVKENFYRNMIVVALLVEKISAVNPAQTVYISEPSIKLARLQIFNEHLLGLEYFCEANDLWQMSDDDLTKFAAGELAATGIIDAADVRSSTVIKVPKACPVFFDEPEKFAELRGALDGIENFRYIGRERNDTARSMLAAIEAARRLAGEQ